jgi:hypothetical protein
MVYGYAAICKGCGTKFEVNEGSGMIVMPFHCERCGKEWWWEFGAGGPTDAAKPPHCECGGTFTMEGPPRCPKCGSPELERDPDGTSMIYD